MSTNQSSFFTASAEAYAPSLKTSKKTTTSAKQQQQPSSAATSRSNSTSSSRSSSYCSCTNHASASTSAYGGPPGYTAAQAAHDAARGAYLAAWPAEEPYRTPNI